MSSVRILVLVTFLVVGIFLPIRYLVLEKSRPGSPGSSLPEPISYAKPVPGGQFTFVAFGSPQAEAALKPGEMKQYAEEIRRKYPKPGMYTAAGSLVYPLDGYTMAAAHITPLAAVAGAVVQPLGSYAPDENVYLSSDGRHVVRIEGDWWQTKAYPAGTRISAEEAQNQLDLPAVSLFLDGKLQASYSLREILTDPSVVPHSPKHILWPGGAVLNERDGRFLVYTQDANRSTFDIHTGERVAMEAMGFGNRFAQYTIIGTLALTVLLAIGLGIWVWKKRRAYTGAA